MTENFEKNERLIKNQTIVLLLQQAIWHYYANKKLLL